MSNVETRIPGAHIADPGPLGLAGFGFTTFLLSLVNSNILHAPIEPVVFGMALAYGGIAQFAAGIWEFTKGNTFGATAFCSFGAFWVSFWYLTGHTDLSGAGKDAHQGIGAYLLTWGIFTLIMTIAATRTTNVVLTVFALLTITFFFLSFGEFWEKETLTHIGGYVGLATALAAFYGVLAGVTNSTYKDTVVPVGPRA
jgi:succinate-acetate transporter protein